MENSLETELLDEETLDDLKEKIRTRLVTTALEEVAKQAPEDSPQHRATQELLKHGGLA